MEDKYYLRINDGKFSFVVEGIHDIDISDNPITIEDYNQFFKLQNEGKQFKLKEIVTGKNLFDYVEEFVSEHVVAVTPPLTLEERTAALEAALLEVL